MQTIDLDDLDPEANPRNRQSVSEALEARDFSMNYYELDPGEGFSGSVHTHLDQEESFFILEGEATFETKAEPAAESETVHVTEGQVIRFDPGEYQQGRNEADEPLRALALGTPQDATESRIAAPCEDCGESEYLDVVMSGGELALECPECGTEVGV